MPEQQNQKPWETEQLALLATLEEVMSVKPDLASDEALYTLQYLRTKLVFLSTLQEELSDKTLALTKRHLAILQRSKDAAGLAELKEATLKDSEQYKGMARGDKTVWLDQQLAVCREEDAAWKHTLTVSDEVREAVAERTQTVKRLDSALRLHQKMLDEGGFHGTGVPRTPPGPPAPRVPILPSGPAKEVGLDGLGSDEIRLT